MPRISVGRIVHFTLQDGGSPGEVRPAIVVRTWGGAHPSVQLQVFTDSNPEGTHNDALPQVMWKTSVAESESGEPEPGRWHWPKREE
jgi:hypothetical protein